MDNNLWLRVHFENWNIRDMSFLGIRTKWLNYFKWFDCYYISNESVEVSISHNWEVTFWPCYILNRLKYKIEDLPKLLVWEKKVTCTEEFCECWINLKKERNKNYLKVIKLEKLVFQNLKDFTVNWFTIKDISIYYKKNITIKFNFKWYIVTYYINKRSSYKNY